MAENQVMAGDKSVESPKNLDFYIKKRSGKKRDYIFSASKMKVCPHNHLHALAVGGNWYRCEDCNYAFCITQAYVQPLHNVVVAGLLNALHFSKEFGSEALQEVLRTPKGQHEADYHLPALPEGMNFWEAAEALDQIDVNSLDNGKAQLQDLLIKTWIPLAERRRRNKELGLPAAEEKDFLGVLTEGKANVDDAIALFRGRIVTAMDKGVPVNAIEVRLNDHQLNLIKSVLVADGEGVWRDNMYGIKVVKESVNGASAKSGRIGEGAKGKALPTGYPLPSVPRRRKGTNPKGRNPRKS